MNPELLIMLEKIILRAMPPPMLINPIKKPSYKNRKEIQRFDIPMAFIVPISLTRSMVAISMVFVVLRNTITTTIIPIKLKMIRYASLIEW